MEFRVLAVLGRSFRRGHRQRSTLEAFTWVDLLGGEFGAQSMRPFPVSQLANSHRFVVIQQAQFSTSIARKLFAGGQAATESEWDRAGIQSQFRAK
jgi:hypothetical protein